MRGGGRRTRRCSRGGVPHRPDSPENGCQSACFQGRHAAVQSRSETVSAAGVHALGRNRVHELFTVPLRFRAEKHRHQRRGHVGRQRQLRFLVELVRQGRVRKERRANAGRGSRGAGRHGGQGSAGEGARVRRRPLAASAVHPALSLHECVDRRRDDSELADVGDQPSAVPQRDRARREDQQPRAE